MSSRKTERLVNLLIMLLVTRRAVGKDRIRDILYADSTPEAFEKMFERDKEELRSLGVPIAVEHLDQYFDDEVGYRVPRDEFALPEISLGADEAAVVGLATRVWQHARLAQATTDAVRKLEDAGVPVDTGALDLVEASLGADEPTFDAFWTAALERTPVAFEYRRGGDPAQTRHVQPWGVVRSSGRWYVVGHDTDRDGPRVFRLSRVQGSARPDGPAGAYTIPPGTDLRAIARRLVPAAPTEQATVLARAGAACLLRRRAVGIETAVPTPYEGSWDRLVLPPGAWSADELVSHGPSVVVEAPDSLRSEVTDRLRTALAQATGDQATQDRSAGAPATEARATEAEADG